MMNALVLLVLAHTPAAAAVAVIPVRPLPLSAPATAAIGSAATSSLSLPPLPVTAPLLAAPATPIAAPTARTAVAAPSARGPVAAPLPAASVPVEAQAAQGSATFDGASAAVPPASPVEPSAQPALGDGLRAMRHDDEPWLASVLGELMRSRTGRRVLRDIARLEARRGYPVLVDVEHISNNGEFRYDSDILVMDSSHRRSDPALTAPIMAHELQHVLQRAMDLPTDALELEIESYTVENHVWSELGVSPPKHSFAAQARRKLLQGGDVFVEWLARQYKNNFSLHGRTMAGYTEKVEAQRATTLKRIERARKAVAVAERAIEVMRASGMPEDAVAAHAREALGPAQRRLKEAEVILAWCDRDLALLADEAGRARFRAYSRGVIRRARALAR